MKLASGAFITDGQRFLVCHATGRDNWDLPKGEVDPGEDLFVACCREVLEETGYTIPEDAAISDCGRHPYLDNKDCHLFEVVVPQLPRVTKLHCDSMVNIPGREPFPEVDDYKYIRRSEARKYLTLRMQKCLDSAGLLQSKEKP